MEKIKEYITKNKKIVIPVAIIIILLLIGGIYLVVQANSDSIDPKIDTNPKQEMKETEKEEKKDLTAYVKGLKDWTVEINAKNVDFLKDVTYDKKVVKDVTVDTSKVDLSKEGKYTLTYSIVPVDNTISKKTVIKTVTVEVISKEKAQKEADKGNQVITSDNEVKKDSKGNTPIPKEEVTSNQSNSNTADNSNSQNTSTNSNSNSNNNSGGGSSNNNGNHNGADNGNHNGNNGNVDPTPEPKPEPTPEPPKHEHNFVYVPEKSHTESGTETYTEEVPTYEWVGWYECNVCHAKFKTVSEVGDHCGEVCGCGYSAKEEQRQTGTETVTKTRPTTKTVVDDPAHYECSCGARQ